MNEKKTEYQNAETIRNLRDLAAFLDVWERADIFLPATVCKCLHELDETVNAELSAEKMKPKEPGMTWEVLDDMEITLDTLRDSVSALDGIEEAMKTWLE